MSVIDYSSHPIALLEEWKSSLRKDDILHFSHYKYVPQSPFDSKGCHFNFSKASFNEVAK